MSKLTVQQLYALGQHIVADPELHRNFYIGNQVRHLEWCAQRNKPEEAEQYFIRTFGKTAEQIIQEISTFQIERAKPKPVPVDKDAIAVRVIDLSAPTSTPQDPRAAVFIDCPVCGKQFAVPVAQKDSAFCSPKCFGAAKNQAANDEHAMLVFMQNTPQFYPCEMNFKEIGDQLERWKKTNITTADIVEAYRNLIQQGKLLKRLTDADLRAMSSADVAAREKVDPGFGGLKLVQEGQRHLQGAFQADTTNATRLLPFAAKGSIGGRGGKEGL